MEQARDRRLSPSSFVSWTLTRPSSRNLLTRPISPSLQAATRDLPEFRAGSARMKVRSATASSRAELQSYVSFRNVSLYVPPRILWCYLTLEVSLRSISGSANCLVSPLSLEIPTCSSRMKNIDMKHEIHSTEICMYYWLIDDHPTFYNSFNLWKKVDQPYSIFYPTCLYVTFLRTLKMYLPSR